MSECAQPTSNLKFHSQLRTFLRLFIETNFLGGGGRQPSPRRFVTNFQVPHSVDFLRIIEGWLLEKCEAKFSKKLVRQTGTGPWWAVVNPQQLLLQSTASRSLSPCVAVALLQNRQTQLSQKAIAMVVLAK
jgi:hypothetical protein